MRKTTPEAPVKNRAKPAPRRRTRARAAAIVIVPVKMKRGPRLMLADPEKWKGAPLLTSDFTQARVYDERSGPYHFLNRNKHLKGKFKPLAIP